MIHFELVTLRGPKFKQSVHEVLLPTPGGQIAVFDNHMPLISVASEGVISIRIKESDPDDFMESFATHGGLIEITDEGVRVLVDEADHADEIVLAEAEKAREAAKEALKNATSPVSIEEAQSLIDRASVRVQVASLKRRRQRR